MKRLQEIVEHKGRPGSRFILLAITALLAAISLSYELMLGHVLSAFFGNTVFQYSLTIGIYMLAMGIGAFVSEHKLFQNSLKRLVQTELALSLVGGSALFLSHLLWWTNMSEVLFTASIYLLIVAIGVLTGLEIPLLARIGEQHHGIKENTVLGIDYAGAFIGALLFAFVLYPFVGLVGTALILGITNAFAGLILIERYGRDHLKKLFGSALGLLSLCVMFAAALIFADLIDGYLFSHYINARV
jgi:spermidine synthase